ncbi:MAG: thioredoxin-dependent thiol peroxidase [Dehalococcoidia bacterium]
MVQAGDQAPDFEALTDTGGPISLGSLRGKKVVLYFYPRDNTPGCTQEACDFRDRQELIQAKNAVVLGISPDSVKSHAGFRQKHGLPFTLIADPEKEIAQKYGVYREKTLYGKKSLGIVRTTFILDDQGCVQKVYDGIRVKGHADAVLEDL